MQAIIRYTILTALRDWLFLGILLLVLLTTGISLFLANTALSEQTAMAAAFITSSVRMITVMGLVVFVCFHVRRSFENKEVELILSKPISRINFVLAYFFGFALLALCMVLPISLLLFSLHKFHLLILNLHGLVLWAVSFYLETLIVVAFSFFSALLLSSAVSSVLFTLSFYFFARIFGFLLISINSVASLSRGNLLGRIAEQVLNAIGVVVPRLDMFSKSEWLIYGLRHSETGNFYLFIQSAFIYVPLILVMAMYDFSHKQF